MCSLDDFTKVNPSALKTAPVLELNNQPPKTVPYLDYQYPNYGTEKTKSFKQPDTGFGFSNFRLSLDNTDALNQSALPKHQHYDRVQLDNPETTQPFSRSEQYLFREKYSDYYTMEQIDAPYGYVHREVIKSIISNNPLSELFFSEKNLDHVLKMSCRLVSLFCEQYKISPEFQSRNDMLIIFRSMFLQVPTNPYGDLEQELCRLNRAVLDWVVPRLIVNIQQYLGYMRDHSTRLVTIPRPQNVNIEGTKANKFFSSLMI